MTYLKCINTGSYHLTVGKIYKAEICNDAPSEFTIKQVFDYYIINDKGIRHGIESSLFVNLQELRISKLEKLGIN
jgi:hypothetical protein